MSVWPPKQPSKGTIFDHTPMNSTPFVFLFYGTYNPCFTLFPLDKNSSNTMLICEPICKMGKIKNKFSLWSLNVCVTVISCIEMSAGFNHTHNIDIVRLNIFIRVQIWNLALVCVSFGYVCYFI